MHISPISSKKGFTLIELLVVISIIAALAAITSIVALRMISKAHKIVCFAMMRDISVAIVAYDADFNQPPIPIERIKERDAVIGVSGGDYDTSALISVLTGDASGEWTESSGDSYSLDNLNPDGIVYLNPTAIQNRKDGGIKDDGKIYDRWGRELMFAFNSIVRGVDENEGKRDKILYTWGLAEWAETKPGFDEFVIWSYGKDGIKGKGSTAKFAGSDDVKSF